VSTKMGQLHWRMVQSLLAESLLLAALGGAAGLAIARWALRLAVAFGPEDVPQLHRATIDGRIVAFTLGVSLLTAAPFGLAPAFFARAHTLIGALRDAGRTTMGRARLRLQSALVVATVALAVVLAAGAGLLVRSFVRLMSTDAGFQSGGILTASVALPARAYASPASVDTFYASLHGRLAALPGVETASLSTDLPLTSNERRGFTPDAATIDDGPPRSVAATWTVGDYFRVLGIELVRGRTFTGADTPDNMPVAVISEGMAARYWPRQDALGGRLKWSLRADSPMPWLTAVGVVRDVNDGPLGSEPSDHVYQPYAQFGVTDPFGEGALRSMLVAVRASGVDETSLTRAVFDETRRLDSSLAMSDVQTMRARVDASVSASRLTMVLLAGFAAGALLLAALGLAVGLAAALALGRLLASLLYQTTPYDAGTLAAVPVVLTAVAALASWLPALRATRIDPIQALRVE